MPQKVPEGSHSHSKRSSNLIFQLSRDISLSRVLSTFYLCGAKDTGDLKPQSHLPEATAQGVVEPLESSNIATSCPATRPLQRLKMKFSLDQMDHEA